MTPFDSDGGRTGRDGPDRDRVGQAVVPVNARHMAVYSRAANVHVAPQHIASTRRPGRIVAVCERIIYYIMHALGAVRSCVRTVLRLSTLHPLARTPSVRPLPPAARCTTRIRLTRTRRHTTAMFSGLTITRAAVAVAPSARASPFDHAHAGYTRARMHASTHAHLHCILVRRGIGVRHSCAHIIRVEFVQRFLGVLGGGRGGWGGGFGERRTGTCKWIIHWCVHTFHL